MCFFWNFDLRFPHSFIFSGGEKHEGDGGEKKEGEDVEDGDHEAKRLKVDGEENKEGDPNNPVSLIVIVPSHTLLVHADSDLICHYCVLTLMHRCPK